MPTPTDLYVPVVDISRHQGIVDMAAMRGKGVEGLIIRSNHAHIVDDRCTRYVMDARAAGWRDDQLGFYTFCNPKRATGEASGKAFVDTVRQVFGHTRTLLMLDVEAYAAESGSGPILQGPAFAAWIREHIATVRRLAPDATLIAYSNASFWNPWVGDSQLASELEWIVPRYPVYNANGYVLHPLPTSPLGWPKWAFARSAAGPFPPTGARWDGWQFSAGYNRQGPPYGCQSSDLDLNIVEVSAWARWTRIDTPAPIPIPAPVPIPSPEEPAMPYLFKLAGSRGTGIRDVTGSRPLSPGEVEGPFAGQTVHDIPADSYWESWVLKELAKYYRELEPPVVVPPSQPGPGGPMPNGRIVWEQ